MKKLLGAYCFLFILLGTVTTSSMSAAPSGQTYYVAMTGNNANSGSMASPWQTVQYGVNQLSPGDTLLVQEGTYNERVNVTVSGSALGGQITIRNAPGESPILDGTGLTVPPSDSGMFFVLNQSYVTIQGFEIRNYTSSINDRVPIGIFVKGASANIELRDNRIHSIETTASDPNRINAHGIAVYGTDDVVSAENIKIIGNELYDLTLGASEALVLNGNVSNFEVSQNIVRDVDNIGIDFIGFEGLAATAVDQARDGIVTDNLVYNVDTLNNPAYFGERSAGGIYVDGGTRIVIERNTVHNANIGIEIASEHAGRATSFITVRNNFVYNNHRTGLAMGGYDETVGSATDNIIVNNTFYHNDTDNDGNGEIWLQYDVRDSVIKNNILYAATGQYLMTNWYSANSGNTVDYNLYFMTSGANTAEFSWKNTYYYGFDAYRSGSSNDANSLFVDPQLVALRTPDLHIQSTSPAISGADNDGVSGATDIDGEVRVFGAGLDMGADEYNSGPATAIHLSNIETENALGGWLFVAVIFCVIGSIRLIWHIRHE